MTSQLLAELRVADVELAQCISHMIRYQDPGSAATKFRLSDPIPTANRKHGSELVARERGSLTRYDGHGIDERVELTQGTAAQLGDNAKGSGAG